MTIRQTRRDELRQYARETVEREKELQNPYVAVSGHELLYLLDATETKLKHCSQCGQESTGIRCHGRIGIFTPPVSYGWCVGCWNRIERVLAAAGFLDHEGEFT